MYAALIEAGLSDADIIAVMPKTAVELVDVLGLQRTLDLLHRIGGSRPFVPKPGNLSDDSELVRQVGMDAAVELSAVFGGCHIEVPLLISVERLLRNQALRAEFDQGATVNNLARRFGLTNRHVRTVIARAPGHG